ncbi:MAG: MBOAT family protein [Roseburia sp.]|nr:MBOAT family protein [Roseburia sp.]MCM1242015.1 MBOAT family protein [Roseburia sp.]
MLFNTMQYIIFLPVVVLVYYLLTPKVRYIWLLITSYYFYMQWNPLYVMLLFSCTFLTYCGARLIENIHNAGHSGDQKEAYDTRKKKKVCFVVCILLNLGILLFFKYFEFGIDCLNHILRLLHVGEVVWDHHIILPVGISFYTLQALGYLIDVYRGDICAEKNFLRYALFVSFFPQLVAGPIERSKNLLAQLREPHSFAYENLRKGAVLILYGLFLKMVVADRAAVLVDTVYGDSGAYPGFYIAVATCFFVIQIYCDFYGYSTIARGSALIMGIHLMDNFKAPFFSRSIKELWQRWHISLSGWFRDYLYIPLGGNRKGSIRRTLNLLIVFAISGLWHGASGAYIFWGLLNGIYQVAGDVVKRVQSAFRHVERKDGFSRHLLQTAGTFGLFTFACLFFRSGRLDTAVRVLQDMFSVNNWQILFDGSLYGLGVARNYMNVLTASIVVLFVVDYRKYKGADVADGILRQEWWFRTGIYMAMLFAILLYGCYGEMYNIQQFIYFQF